MNSSSEQAGLHVDGKAQLHFSFILFQAAITQIVSFLVIL